MGRLGCGDWGEKRIFCTGFFENFGFSGVLIFSFSFSFSICFDSLSGELSGTSGFAFLVGVWLRLDFLLSGASEPDSTFSIPRLRIDFDELRLASSSVLESLLGTDWTGSVPTWDFLLSGSSSSSPSLSRPACSRARFSKHRELLRLADSAAASSSLLLLSIAVIFSLLARLVLSFPLSDRGSSSTSFSTCAPLSSGFFSSSPFPSSYESSVSSGLLLSSGLAVLDLVSGSAVGELLSWSLALLFESHADSPSALSSASLSRSFLSIQSTDSLSSSSASLACSPSPSVSTWACFSSSLPTHASLSSCFSITEGCSRSTMAPLPLPRISCRSESSSYCL